MPESRKRGTFYALSRRTVRALSVVLTSLPSRVTHSQLQVAAYLVGILGTALYLPLATWRTPSGLEWIAQVLLLFVLPADLRVGLFHYILELLGGKIRVERTTTMSGRWSLLLHVSQWTFAPSAFIFWILLASPSELLTAESFQAYLATAFWIAVAAVCAAVYSYLVAHASESPSVGASPRRNPFAWLAQHLQPTIAIPVGAILVLSSLRLYSSLSPWSSGRHGFEILAGSVSWITSEHLPDAYPVEKQILFWAGRSLYVLGVSVAAVTAFLWMGGRGRIDFIRSRLGRIMPLIVLIGLFAVSDLFFGFLALDDQLPRPVGHAIFCFRTAYWIAPIVLEPARSHGLFGKKLGPGGGNIDRPVLTAPSCQLRCSWFFNALCDVRLFRLYVRHSAALVGIPANQRRGRARARRRDAVCGLRGAAAPRPTDDFRPRCAC